MTDNTAHRTPARISPPVQTTGEFRTQIADTLDDARAGHITELTRNGRPIAALVPIEVARAYASDAETRTRLLQFFAALMTPAVTEIEQAVGRLRDNLAPLQGPPEEDPDPPALPAQATAADPDRWMPCTDDHRPESGTAVLVAREATSA